MEVAVIFVLGVLVGGFLVVIWSGSEPAPAGRTGLQPKGVHPLDSAKRGVQPSGDPQPPRPYRPTPQWDSSKRGHQPKTIASTTPPQGIGRPTALTPQGQLVLESHEVISAYLAEKVAYEEMAMQLEALHAKHNVGRLDSTMPL